MNSFSDAYSKKNIKILFIIGKTDGEIKRNKDKDGASYFTGLGWDLWKLLEEKLSDRYVFQHYFTDELGESNTNYDALVKEVADDKYTMVVGNFYQTPWREKIVNFSIPTIVDATAVIHYPSNTITGQLRSIVGTFFKLILMLLLTGTILGFILANIDRKRQVQSKGIFNYFKRVIFSSITAMFGETGFLAENTSLTIKGMFTVIIIMIIAFMLVMYAQGQITARILNNSVGVLTPSNIVSKQIICFKGYAAVEKLERYNMPKIKTFEFKDTDDGVSSFQKLIDTYKKNRDKYDGVTLAITDAKIELEQNVGLVASTNFGYEPSAYVVSKNEPRFLKDLNIELLNYKDRGHELKRICDSYFDSSKETYKPICSTF